MNLDEYKTKCNKLEEELEPILEDYEISVILGALTTLITVISMGCDVPSEPIQGCIDILSKAKFELEDL